MKNIYHLLLPLALLLAFHAGAQQGAMIDDGPYVRYAGNQILVSFMEQDDDLLMPNTVVYNGLLTVVPEGHPDWAFSVKLRDSLPNDPAEYSAFSKSFFVSDIEGEFANFRKLLLAAKVIDEQYNWTYGNNSLIIPGDLFDRGKDIVPELWLLYKLEEEAKAQGGSVQVILGNHDIMNLSGDHRYTDGKYFKNAWLLKKNIDDLFGPDTELGRWLRSKNVIEKCGDVLVMHGGMSPAIRRQHLSLEQLNAVCRPYDDPSHNPILFGRDALFWYRGYFMGTKVTMAEVDSTLKFYGCHWIVVGHTIVKWNIASYYGGKVIAVDVDEHTNHTKGALLENGKWFIIDDRRNKAALVYDPKNDNVNEKDIL